MSTDRDRTAEEFTAALVADAGPAVLERWVPLLYDELRRVARAQLRGERDNHSLQPTALVHEVYLRLIDATRITVEGRAHFLSLAARVMRQILVDHARRKHAGKRGGDATLIEVGEAVSAPVRSVVDVLALDEALQELGTFDPRQRDIVELKFFGGLTIQEIAATFRLSHATIEREWAMAKAWLYARLSGAPS